jgi:hypothetical protein
MQILADPDLIDLIVVLGHLNGRRLANEAYVC